MKKLYLGVLSLFSFVLAVGQLVYTPETSYHDQGAYSSLGTSGTLINTSNKDDANSAAQAIGFNFNFNGTNYTHFILNTNGFIKLGTSSSMTSPSAANLAYTYFNQTYGGVLNSTSTDDHQILAVFHHDLDSSTTANTSYRFQTTGSTGNRVCTIEFQNVIDKNITDSSGSPLPHIQFQAMNFQIKLYEANRMIEYVYGNFIPTNDTSLFKVAGVGMKGSNNNQILTAFKGSSSEYDMAEFQATNYAVGGGGFNFGNNNNSIGKVIPDNVIRPLPLPGKIIRFLPKVNNDVEVSTIHSRHAQAIPWGVPYSIAAQVNNVGNNSKSALWVTFEVSGANSYKDSTYINSLAAGATIKPVFSGYVPQNLGTDIMRVYTSSDNQPENNEYRWVQKVDNNEIGYGDSSNVFRSLGWSGGGGIFACKYYITGKRRIGKVRVKIGNNTNSIGQQVYGVIADASGNILGRSGVKIITASDLTQWMEFDISGSPTAGVVAPPPLISNADVLIGFAIPGAFNPLCLQWEKNNRLNTFYYRGALTSGTFSDLGALAGFDQYRMAINGRLEGVSLKLEPITGINDPSCASSNQPFEVTVTNQDTFAIDFSADTLHLEVTSTGAISQTHSLLVNSGILEPDSSQTFTITNNFDLSVAGQYNIIVEARQWFEVDTANNYKNITVNVVDTPGVSLKVIPDSILCFGTPFYFEATPYTAGSAQYQWKVNGINQGPITSSDTFSSPTIDWGDSVMVDLITDHCTTTTIAVPSNKIRMEVNPPPRLINGIIGVDTIIENTTKNYIVGVVAGNSYLWQVSGGSIAGDSTKSTVKVNWDGPNTNAQISLTETGSGNCIRTNVLPVVIISVVGLNDKESIGIGTAYPNPADQSVNIPVFANQNSSIELALFDITGKKVRDIYSGNLSGNKVFSLNVNDLREGLYFYKIRTSSGYEKVSRLSIKH